MSVIYFRNISGIKGAALNKNNLVARQRAVAFSDLLFRGIASGTSFYIVRVVRRNASDG